MDQTTKLLVQDSYNQIADSYLQWTTAQSSPREHYTNGLLSHLAHIPQPHILDLGCASGLPTTRLLLDRGASVVANDFSSRQIELARETCPEAECIAGDMMTLNRPVESFDGVVCFYALFHLPRAEQPIMLHKIWTWLRSGGVLVMSLGASDGESRGTFLGHDMVWSSLSAEGNQEMVEQAGFELLESQVLEAGDGKLLESDPDYGVKFMWLVAVKK